MANNSAFDNWPEATQNFWVQESGFQDMPALRDDWRVQQWFYIAYEDPSVSHDTRMEAREELKDWFYEEYELIFDDTFDWQAWREHMGYQ